MKNFRKHFENLEKEVHAALIKKIRRSKYYSKFITDSKCIKLDLDNYVELVLLNNEKEILVLNDVLLLLDDNGLQYSLYNVSTSTLIDILEMETRE